MAFKKSEIFRMKEAEFQTKVLIPLFRAMQFRDVTPFGGGNLERGKDIIMWKESDFGQRQNFGVVVKAKKITGNAETNSGAMNVLNQVRQMLKTPFLNPVTGDREIIKRCIVACSKEITKEAMNSIEGELENDLNKLVEWIHPETNLFDLIEKYLPELSIFDNLSSAQKKLDEAMKLVPYRIVADTDNRFSILAKHEKASEEMPFIIKTKLKFDTTPEGREAFEKVREHFTKGSQVEIEGRFIESLNLPNFVLDWMKPQITDDTKLIIGANRSEYTIPIYFRRTLANGERIDSGNLDVWITEGTEIITLENDKQKTPLHCKIAFNKKEKSAEINLMYQFYGFNVYEHLQALKFYNSMSRQGETDIYRSDFGIKVLQSQKGETTLKEDFNRDIILLESLVLIQEKMSVILNLSEDSLTNENIANIFEVAEIIKNGKLIGRMPELIANVSLESAKKSIKGFEDETINFIFVSYPEGWKYNILGNEINTGVAVLSTNVFISKNNFKEIEKNIMEGKETMEFCLTPEDETVIVDFISWDCADRHKRFQITH